MKALGVIAAIIVFGLWLGGRIMRSDTETDVKEKEIIRIVDSVYVTDTVRLTKVRYQTDTTLLFITDTVIKARVDTVIRRERAACDAVIRTCEKRVAARDQRVRTLEKRDGGTLFLFGEAGAEGPLDFSKVAFDGEAGVAVRLDRQTKLQGSATTDETLRIVIRRDLRLF